MVLAHLIQFSKYSEITDILRIANDVIRVFSCIVTFYKNFPFFLIKWNSNSAKDPHSNERTQQLVNKLEGTCR